ncbi:unnamed protein product [Kuraishia capsulata CBS 1993]|uniref:TIGR01456 family HAD hydrolase n=1 Tax=Kuraishia capsulata CBS 1993 TaxID=1382522 RepID=W6MJT0_9ASCO|nr:uncharacterized protein KUCA_T00002768001 [Kuraishia capsulata CBS 1993]CDK26794.1 unnamed protein product [Kuraishia capsulata CBS 1993]
MSSQSVNSEPKEAATAGTTLSASPATYSFLNNDGIDQMTPLPRKKASSLSLSDQWTSLHSMTKLTQLDQPGSGAAPARASSTNLKRYGSRLSTGSLASIGSRRPSITQRIKRTVIDHARVASYAFAFDIDGVIVKGPNTIPEAKEAMRMLNGENPYNVKVPYIFVTNGGGRDEEARSKDLSDRLGVEITKDQVIQGHTPMKDLVDVYDNVLVVGGVGDACRKVAEGYGFKNVYIPLDVMNWNPSVSPYYTLTEEDKKVVKDADFSKINIQAILVFADSRNWAADQQIILDLLLSKDGVLGTDSTTYEEGPGIYFAHSDFVWATNYKQSRYGMGALQVSIAALFREHTGKELKVIRFGKPQRGTFKYANKVLTKWRKDVLDEHVEEMSAAEETEDDSSDELHFTAKSNKGVFISDSEDEDDGDSDDEGLTVQKLSQLTLDLPPASTVYFVGDTPESDIRFANSHDESWHSILVKTGVYQGGTIPKYKPKHTCENVLEAVKYAIEREHKMELEEWNKGALEPEHGAVDVPVTLEEKIVEKPEKEEK